MKITFGAIVTDGSGKLGGHAAQKGRTGAILRTIGQPRKTPSRAQSLQRSDVQIVSQSWRTLTNEERQTWISAAEEKQSGFDLYIEVNLKLLTANLPLLSQYVIQTPWNIEYPLYRTHNYGFFDPEGSLFQFTINNYFGMLPYEGWTPRVLWTGWIPLSKYKYPAISKVLPASQIQALYNFIQLTWLDYSEFLALPYSDQCKAKLTLQWINNSTGAIFTLGTYEVIPSDSGFNPIPYMPETGFSNPTFTSVPGGYRVTSHIFSNNESFDFSEWEPWWFISDWYDENYEGAFIANRYIDPSLFTFVNSGEITLIMNPTDDPNLTPPGPGYYASVQAGWKNVNTGEVVSERGGAYAFES